MPEPANMTSEALAYSNASNSTIVQALCRDILSRGVNLNVSQADEMLLFFLYAQGLNFDQAVASYFESGRRIWAVQRQIMAWRFRSPEWDGNVLDFASGYGRVTRHIVAEIPKERVWVADIYAAGVAFQQREFGVHGLVSTADPAAFQCDQRFDCILVSSLFTHLPAPLFNAWLGRLGALLETSGLLLFSVHDMSLRPPEAGTGSPTEIVFKEQSESGSLDTREYGTSWVTEEFVRAAVKKAFGSCPVLRIPRGLVSFQDLYAVLKEAGADSAAAFSDLKVEREADGFLEHCSWETGRRLRLSGWLADRVAGRPPQEVRIWIDGVLAASCRDLSPRPSVAQAFAGDPVEAVGWQTVVELPETSHPEAARIEIQAVSIAGETLSLYSGWVSEACLRTAQLDNVMLQNELRVKEATFRQELAALSNRLAAMEASRFWKLRNFWFRLKRAAGLTKEI
jgi:SAM-dependent methyltransferase